MTAASVLKRRGSEKQLADASLLRHFYYIKFKGDFKMAALTPVAARITGLREARGPVAVSRVTFTRFMPSLLRSA